MTQTKADVQVVEEKAIEKASKIDTDQVFSIDQGYSKVKSKGSVDVKFPSYVVPNTHVFGTPTDPFARIIYTDETGQYVVGQGAFDDICANPELYKQEEKMNRYYFRNHKYLITFRTAMALAYPNKTKHKIPLVVSGLPSEYVEADSPELETILMGTHKFQITFGGVTTSYEITCGAVIILPQPYGTLSLFAYNSKGELIRPKILNAYTRVHDWGFKTTDPQLTLNGVTVSGKCFSLVGQRETTSQVYEEVRKYIREKTGKDVPVIVIRDLIDEGTFRSVSENLERTVLNLKEFSEPIFREAVLNVIKQVIRNNGNIDVKYDILTGGGAGNEWILDEYKKVYGEEQLFYPQMEGIEVEPDMANATGYKNFGVNALVSIQA